MGVITDLLLIGLCVGSVSGHGMMMDPPSRNSMWRVGFETPKNYNDMGLNCGGFAEQWQANGGKCGLCGDDYSGSRLHEAGGTYAPVNRPISRCYNPGDNTIPVDVRITAYHKGYFEFRLCVNNNMYQDPGQACLDNGHLLTVAGTKGLTRFDINGAKQESYELALDMPDVTCTQCILQWKYNTGNSYGCDGSGNCGIGFGAQEQFINCADISILEDCTGSPTVDPKATKKTPGTDAPYTTTEADDGNDDKDGDDGKDGNDDKDGNDVDDGNDANDGKDGDDGKDDGGVGTTCVANEVYAGVPDMDEWCDVNCHNPEYPYCPDSHCVCY